MRATAELAGISESHLSRIERNERPVDKRSLIAALADALQVSPSEITGQPYPATSHGEAVGHSAAPALRAVLRDIELGEEPPTPRRFEELRVAVSAVNKASAACDYGTLGVIVPGLIAELHALADGGSAEARRLLVDALHAAFYLSKDLGHGDLAWSVSGHLHRATQSLGDPTWGGVADFVRAHAVVGLNARKRGLALAERAADTLPADEHAAGQVHGMLHLSAALNSAVTGEADQARAHLDEAADIAARTGDGDFAGLHFGPRNVGVWHVSVALELGEAGRVPEIARGIDVAVIPSAGRQASFYADVGRGYAATRAVDRAVEAFRRAEQLAPERTRSSPWVREAVSDLMRRAHRDAGGRELRGLAYRMGLAG